MQVAAVADQRVDDGVEVLRAALAGRLVQQLGEQVAVLRREARGARAAGCSARASTRTISNRSLQHARGRTPAAGRRRRSSRLQPLQRLARIEDQRQEAPAAPPSDRRVAESRSTSGRSVPEALLMTWRSLTSSPWTSLMTWTVPLGRVSSARQPGDLGEGGVEGRELAGQRPQGGQLHPAHGSSLDAHPEVTGLARRDVVAGGRCSRCCSARRRAPGR